MKKWVLMAGILLLTGVDPVASAEPDEDRFIDLVNAYTDARKTKKKRKLIRNIRNLDLSFSDAQAYLNPTGRLTEEKTGKFRVSIRGSEKKGYAYVPTSYDPDDPMPLVVGLHGSGGDGDQILKRITGALEKYDVMAVCPSGGFRGGLNWARGNPNLVFRSIRVMREKYNVDTNRIYLMGASLGGFGTWNVGLRYPDRYAAIMPLLGGISMATFTGNPDKKTKTYVRRLLTNALNLPVYVVHSAKDQVVPVEGDRRAARILEELGYTHVYREMKNWPHVPPKSATGLIENEFFPWLLQWERNPFPDVIKFHPVGSRANHAYWVRINETNGDTPGIAVKKKPGNKIHVTTEGIEKYTLFFHPSFIDYDRLVEIVTNGQRSFKGELTKEWPVFLNSYRRYRDHRMIFFSAVEVTVKTVW